MWGQAGIPLRGDPSWEAGRPAAPARSVRLPVGSILAVVLALGAALRGAMLGAHSLWFDEAWVAWTVGHRWSDVLALLRTADAHPPLYYLVMKAWTALAGTTEVALRAPSACFSAVSVGLTYALARRVAGDVPHTEGRAVPPLAAFLVAASPFAVMAAQDARMYALLGMLALWATLALAAAVERGGMPRWAAYATLALLLIYTHYCGALVLLAHGIWVGGWERRHFRTWAIGLAAVVALYAPWMPATWQQIGLHTHRAYLSDWSLSRTTLNLSATVGLLAFGGSLLGAPGYFGGGRLGAGQQLLILVPFLALIWRGVASLAYRPRGLALVGLPLFIAGGWMFAGSLVRAGVLPRQFSFLVPFYAMVLAAGVVEVAATLPRRRGLAAALLAAGCVLAGVPALSRYYFNPDARLYDWRAAAAFVESQAGRSGQVVYVGWEPDIALTYYFRHRHPSLVLLPTEVSAGPPGRPSFGSAQARELASRFPRAWLVITVPGNPDDPYMRQRLFPELGSAFRISGPRDFGGIWVYRLEARSPAH